MSQKGNFNNNSHSVIKIIWLIFCFFIVYGTLIPFNISFTKESLSNSISSINWIPFFDPDGSRASIPDLFQNILLFIPFGFLGFLSITKRLKYRFVIVVFLGVLLSISVEALQLFAVDRITSISDLLTNTTGALIGFFAASFVSKIFPGIIMLLQSQENARSHYLFILVLSTFVVAAGSLQPFDFTLDVGGVLSKVKALLHNPFHFTPALSDEGVVFFRFVLFSYVWVLWFQERRLKYFVIAGVVVSCLIGVFLEGCQIIIKSRMPGAQDLIVIVTGSICGGFLEIFLRYFKIRAIPLFITAMTVTLITAGIQTLSPFQLSEEYRAMNWVPFLPYYDRTTFVALSNFIESVLTYFPMGFLLQHLLSKKIRTLFCIGIIALAMAYFLEFSQGWIEGRCPDITDVLGGVIGAISGAWANAKCWLVFNNYVEGFILTRQNLMNEDGKSY